jgi:hypothetical protein
VCNFCRFFCNSGRSHFGCGDGDGGGDYLFRWLVSSLFPDITDVSLQFCVCNTAGVHKSLVSERSGDQILLRRHLRCVVSSVVRLASRDLSGS